MIAANPRWLSIETKQNRWFYFTLFAFTALIGFALWQKPQLSGIESAVITGFASLYTGAFLWLMVGDNTDRCRHLLVDYPQGFALLMAANAILFTGYLAVLGSGSSSGFGSGFSAGSLSWLQLTGMVCYWLLPALLLRQAQKNPERCGVFDILLLLSFWAPIHSGAIGYLFSGTSAALSPTLGQAIIVPAATFSLAVATIGVRQFEDVGLTLEPLAFSRANLPTWLTTGKLLAIALALVGGFAMVTGHLRPQRLPIMAITGSIGTSDIFYLVEVAITTFLLVALPAELMFRGLILNILEKTSGSTLIAVGVSALIYGVSLSGAEPDLTLVALNTGAGVIYGLCYLRTASIIHSALISTTITLAIFGSGVFI